MMPETKWVVWRRPVCGQGTAWTRLEGAYGSRTEAIRAVSAWELKAGIGEWTYTVMPEGKTPAVYPGQTYRHRMMKPDP